MNKIGCMLCPRRCGINRGAGERGFCGSGDEIKIGRYGLHFWEEPCISGKNGSGAVFFSYCNLRCVFCQNYEISTMEQGKIITTDELAEIFLRLQAMNAHNINLVTPTHYADKLVYAIDNARSNGLKLPIIYNTSGYESLDTLKMLDGYIDVYLPDFKYWRKEPSLKYSSAPDYPEIAREAISEMFKQTGCAEFENGIIKKGTIVRHLLLPGGLYDAKKIIDYLCSSYGDEIFISIMNQYTPLKQVEKLPPLNRKVGAREYDALINYAVSIGVQNAYIQNGETALESFIPEFYK